MIYYENLALLNQQFSEELQHVFQEVLAEGWFIEGRRLGQFEAEFAAYCQVKYCIGVSNGLDALKLALIALDLPPQSEIIVPAHTFIATILSVIHAGHIPVLIEPDMATYNINPQQIEEKISSKTRALLAVHLYGKMCNMSVLIEIAHKYNLYLIEDAAQAHGARYNHQVAGSFGDMAAFSFYPSKNLGALGDAGAVISNHSRYALKLKALRNYGSSEKYHYEMIGHNNRLDELQAAFLSVKLRYLDQINAHKRQLARIYLQYLKEDFIKPQVHPDYEDVFHIFAIRHPQRDQLKAYLIDKGIQTGIHYPIPPHRQNALKSYFVGENYPLCEEIHKTILSLPISFIHKEEEIYQIIDVMNQFSM
ncbi:MAG: DegT/DnrJ/EryC1/StrS family aminotransferase [Microscillaceae bacterium]|nr:DegT/DnrJ/EryC1/StrS family aminotransferase [Microscillaceae bacterium]